MDLFYGEGICTLKGHANAAFEVSNENEHLQKLFNAKKHLHMN